ncbi:proteasome assembly chaperone 2 [Diorhabda sublineata]|uniref:proteasome assembly chaperone 2 n=1 Tax=Diorhabda sublineata TaxID=1163346 RepID=UPI0024E157C4|nr:proteasome assembly chaperone 2 [Diorhabda sublineata]
MPPILKFFENVDLNEFTLLIPSVSVGNVPQLTLDLLIKTFDFQKIASLWHPSIVSSVGADPYDFSSPKICMACELYSNEKLKVACMQLRSTLDSKMANKFFEDIYNCINNLNFKQIIILSSAFDYELPNINKKRFYFLDNLQNNVCNLPDMEQLDKDLSGKYRVNGAGFALNLYAVLSKGLKCILLGKYISEGDNRPDAQAVLEKVLQVLHVKMPKMIQYPRSWDLVFGGPPPIGIY